MFLTHVCVQAVPSFQIFTTLCTVVSFRADMFGFNMISHIGGLGLVATFNTPPLATAQTSHHHCVHTCTQIRPSLFTIY